MTEPPITAIELLRRGPVIPVVVIEHSCDAAPLARALLAGGIDTMEITLRTPEALSAIRSVAELVPRMSVGAGTVLCAAQARAASDAGATFLVSPGSTPSLLDALMRQAVPFLPGVATVSEVMAVLEHGITEMKFFPAAAAGGPPMLRALAGPLPGATFCPTGGVAASAKASYLELPNVACVGGSWLTPSHLVTAGKWDALSALAAAAIR